MSFRVNTGDYRVNIQGEYIFPSNDGSQSPLHGISTREDCAYFVLRPRSRIFQCFLLLRSKSSRGPEEFALRHAFENGIASPAR